MDEYPEPSLRRFVVARLVFGLASVVGCSVFGGLLRYVGLSENVSIGLAVIAFLAVYYIVNISRWRVRALEMPTHAGERRHHDPRSTIIRQH